MLLIYRDISVVTAIQNAENNFISLLHAACFIFSSLTTIHQTGKECNAQQLSNITISQIVPFIISK